jgi:hypothetical protein
MLVQPLLKKIRWRSPTLACAVVLVLCGPASGYPRHRPVSPSFSWLTNGVPPAAGEEHELATGEIWLPMSDGPEGAPWVGGFGGVGRFDKHGNLHLHFLEKGGRILGLAAGRDGTVWALRSTVNIEEGSELIHINGSEETRVLWMKDHYGGSVASAPDGNLWVATNGGSCNQPGEQPCGHTLIRFGAGREMKDFAIPISEDVSDVAVGADGNVWFVVPGDESPGRRDYEVGDSVIGRMTPSGHFSSWTVQTEGAPVRGLAAGPGGMWFSAGASAVGRVGYGGKVKMFSKGLPADSYPDRLTRGPEGAMWFTEMTREALGRIEADGHVTQVPWGRSRPNPSDADIGGEAIAVAPHHTLIFYRPVDDEFGRVAINGQCIVPRLTGLSLNQVNGALRSADCRLGHVRNERNGSIAGSQRIRPGELLKHGAYVAVGVVSKSLANRRCLLKPGQHEMLSDGKMLLFGEPQPPNVEEEEEVRYGVCVFGGNGVMPIDDKGKSARWGGKGTGMFTMAGDYLAWQSVYSVGGAGSLASVQGIDAATGKSVGSSGNFPPTGLAIWTEARAIDLAIDEGGDLAWVLNRPATYESHLPPTEEVQVLAAGKPLTLESAAIGTFGRLSFSPSGTLRWTNDGQLHTYVFTK